MALLKGTLDVLVLKTLSWTPMHAFEITTWLEDRSSGRRRRRRRGAASGAAPDGGAPTHRRGMGCDEERTPRAILSADALRGERTCAPNPRGWSIISTR